MTKFDQELKKFKLNKTEIKNSFNKILGIEKLKSVKL